MRIKSLLIFFTSAIISLAAGGVSASSANIIPNPSLETPASLSTEPESWFPDFFGNQVATFAYPVAGHTGNGAKVIVTKRRSGDAKWFFTPQTVVGGHTYTFSEWYTSTISSLITIQYALTDESLTSIDIAHPTASPNWKQFNTAIKVPANAVKISIFHHLKNNGTLTTDDYSLRDNNAVQPPPPPPPLPPPSLPSFDNLIQNPSLEDVTDNQPTGWFPDNWGTNGAIFTFPVQGKTGNNAAKVTINAYTDGDAKWVSDWIPAHEGEDYLFSDYFFSDRQSLVLAGFKYEDGTRSYTIVASLPATSSWTKVEKPINVPPHAIALSVFHLIRGIGNLTTDDYSLTKLSSGLFPQGMVTLWFDDGELTPLMNAFPIIDAAGLKVTENGVSSFMGQPSFMTTAQLLGLNAAGYDLQSETRTHPYLTTLSNAEASGEIAGSKSDLLGLGLSPISLLTYPYGDFDERIEELAKAAGYLGARGTYPGYNTKNTDKFALRTQNMLNTTTISEVRLWIDNAIRTHTWLIITFHDVEENTSGNEYDNTPSILQQMVNYIEATHIPVVTASQGIAAM